MRQSCPAGQSVSVSGANVSGINFTASQAAAPGTIFSDGFESGGWTSAGVSGHKAKWTIATSGSHPGVTPHSGSELADFDSCRANSGDEARLYHTSSFAIAGSYSTVTLTFWMYHDTGSAGADDRVQVQVSTNGSTWTNVGSPISRYNGSTGWQQSTVDLSAYKGQTIYLGFLGISANGNDEYIDDVTVAGQ